MNRGLEAIIGVGTIGAAATAAAIMGPEDVKGIVNAAKHISENGYAPLVKSALLFVPYIASLALGLWSVKRAVNGSDNYVRPGRVN